MPKWILSQIGSREHYAVPRAFNRLDQLERLITDIWIGSPILRRAFGGLSVAALRSLVGRYHPDLNAASVSHFSAGALWRSFRSRRRTARVEQYLEYIDYGRWFAEAVARSLRAVDLDPETHRFFSFDTGCLETIEELKSRSPNLPCVVDQIDPAQVEHNLVQKEAQRWTGWEASPGEIPQQYWARLSAEWRAADFVVVNSEWSRDALVSQGVTTEKVIVVPLAYEPPSVTQRVAPRQTDALKVLWLGTVCLRKGIQYLLAAAKELLDENIEFKIAGPISISQDAIKTAPKNTTFIGRVTRDQASHHYLNADLFVLPTVSDGFAVTQLEAMAHGLPVITTPNCGRVVTSGSDGFVVPACDASSLAKAILACHRDRDLLSLMSANALETSKQYRLPRQAVEINSAVNRLVV